MTKFVVSPHFRLQEWVAEQKGYFTAEGLDYEFREALDSLWPRPPTWRQGRRLSDLRSEDALPISVALATGR